MDAIYIQSTPINIFNSGFDYQDNFKIWQILTWIKDIILWQHNQNDVKISGYTLDAQEE